MPKIPPSGTLKKGGIISVIKLPELPTAQSVGAVQAMDQRSQKIREQQIQRGRKHYTRDQLMPVWNYRQIHKYYTPSTTVATPYTLTRRAADMLGAQLRFDQRYVDAVADAADRDSYVSVDFLEWLMGYPKGFVRNPTF